MSSPEARDAIAALQEVFARTEGIVPGFANAFVDGVVNSMEEPAEYE